MTDNAYTPEWAGDSLTVWNGPRYKYEVEETLSDHGHTVLKAKGTGHRLAPVVGVRIDNVRDPRWTWTAIATAFSSSIGTTRGGGPIWAAARSCNNGLMAEKYREAYGRPIPC